MQGVENPFRDNSLVIAAQSHGISFGSVPIEGIPLVQAVDKCCRAVNLDPNSIYSDPKHLPEVESEIKTPIEVMVKTIFRLGFMLPFLSYPDIRYEGDQERAYLTVEQTSQLREGLQAITSRNGFMESIEKIVLIDSSENPIMLADVLHAHSKDPITQ